MSDSKRCVMSCRSRCTTTGCVHVFPSSSERANRMSPVKFADVGDVQVTYMPPRASNASFGRFSPSEDTGSGCAFTRRGVSHAPCALERATRTVAAEAGPSA